MLKFRCDLLKKKLQSFLTTLLFSLFIACPVISKGMVTPTRDKIVHLYLDQSTIPVLLQAVDLLKQPKSESKIIIWDRYRKLNSSFLASYNAISFPIPYDFRSGYQQRELDTFFKNELEKYIKDKDTYFVIHANIFHSNAFLPFLFKIPKQKIRHIHLYEDGLGNIIEGKMEIKIDEQRLKICIEHRCNHLKGYEFSLSKIYPVTYHIAFTNEVKEKFKNIKDFDFQNVNFQEIANTLTMDQKKELFKLFGFDFDAYDKMILNKKVFFFIIGHGRPIPISLDHFRKWYSTHNTSDSILFFKGNYSLFFGKDTSSFEDNPFQNLHFFKDNIPFELLVIAGLTPTEVSGTFSSLFYSIPKRHIGKIFSENSKRLKALKSIKRLDNTQIEIITEHPK